MKNNAVHRLRLISMPEGMTFVLLLIAVPFKYTTSFDAVKVLGPIHGVLWTICMLCGLLAWWEQRWSFRYAFLGALLLSVVPGGGFIAERILRRQEEAGYVPAPAAA